MDPFSRYPGLPISELPHTFRDLARRIEAKELLEPGPGVGRLVYVSPSSCELGNCGGIDFLVEGATSVIFYTVFDGSDC